MSPFSPSFSPDELKALVLHYGSYNKASKALGIGKASLVDAANADIKGSGYKLKTSTTDKIYKHTRRFGEKTKRELHASERFLAKQKGNPNYKKAFMNMSNKERQEAIKTFKKYKNKMREDALFSKIMSKSYDRHGWQRGKFSR